jgi:hypothetical protein
MSIYSKPPTPEPPFTREGTPLFPSCIADELEEIIPTMGAQGPNPLTSPIPIRVEEQYEINERRAITTNNTAPVHYDVITTEPKTILVVADGADHYVDFNQQISSDSPKIFNGGSLSITSKGVTRIWAQTVSASSSTLRILVFKR